MMNKRSKTSRERGNKTHGWGHKKKHRGYGNKGGRGNAGSGKRGDAKKPSYWEDPKYLGSQGFTSHHGKTLITITLRDLDKQFKEGNVNLTELGYDKVLGTGSVNKKFNITVSSITNKAAEKIQAAGGKIIGAEPAKEEVVEPKAEVKE